MNVILYIISLITKLILPLAIVFLLTNAYLNRRYHFVWNDEKLSQPSLRICSVYLIIIGTVCLIADILYYTGIKAKGVLGRVLSYLVEEQHSTVVSFFKYGLMEKPFRTWLYIIFLILALIVGLAFFGVINASCKKNEKEL